MVDENCLAVVGNLKKVRNSWARLTRILGQEGYNPRIYGVFSKAVVQAVLLWGSETWVLTPHMERSLGIFQYRVTRWMIGRILRRRDKGIC